MNYYGEENTEYWEAMNEYHDSLIIPDQEDSEEDPFTGSLEDYGLHWRDFL